MLSNVRNDIRYALRTLGRNPGFAVAAIVPIALGIGINTGVFSILNSVAWRSLPVPEPDALVSIYQDFRGGPRRMVHGARSLFSIPEYRAYRDEAHTLSGLMAYSREWTVAVGRESPQEIRRHPRDVQLLRCARIVSRTIGTGFTPANCGTSDAPPIVVVSHGLWKSAFGGDPQILQKPIVLNGRDVTVVGVAPVGFEGVDMAKAAFFAPTSMEGVFRPEQSIHENAHVSWLTLIGRRRTDAAIAQVRADLSLVARRHRSGASGSHDVADRGTGSRSVAPGCAADRSQGSGDCHGRVRPRAADRRRQRRQHPARARGGSNQRDRDPFVCRRNPWPPHSATADRKRHHRARRRGVRLAALLWSFQALIPWLLTSIPGGGAVRIDATPDRTVLWFALGLTAVTALVFGLVPALQASTGDAPCRDEAGRRGLQRRTRLDSRTLIGAQIALCTMLLIPAGLLSRALYAAHTFDPGFDHRNVAVVSIDLRGPRYEKGNAAIFHEQWLERVRGIARRREHRGGEPYSVEPWPQPDNAVVSGTSPRDKSST